MTITEETGKRAALSGESAELEELYADFAAAHRIENSGECRDIAAAEGR